MAAIGHLGFVLRLLWATHKVQLVVFIIMLNFVEF